MATKYVVHFNFKGVNSNVLKQIMIKEYTKAYNYYCGITNSGLTDKLNKEFNELYPDYNFSDEHSDNIEYCRFMADGYQKRIVDAMNNSRFSRFMDFYVDPVETIFVGCLRWNHNATIDFDIRIKES